MSVGMEVMVEKKSMPFSFVRVRYSCMSIGKQEMCKYFAQREMSCGSLDRCRFNTDGGDCSCADAVMDALKAEREKQPHGVVESDNSINSTTAHTMEDESVVGKTTVEGFPKANKKKGLKRFDITHSTISDFVAASLMFVLMLFMICGAIIVCCVLYDIISDGFEMYFEYLLWFYYHDLLW
ncbi:MAG: hypothetical protein PHW45_04615 [Candidatus ainarchaeum sp.]|nr:hypothetical protein [Candidatus ainarchaeum sp.]